MGFILDSSQHEKNGGVNELIQHGFIQEKTEKGKC
jgi:hypothetical protein